MSVTVLAVHSDRDTLNSCCLSRTKVRDSRVTRPVHFSSSQVLVGKLDMADGPSHPRGHDSQAQAHFYMHPLLLWTRLRHASTSYDAAVPNSRGLDDTRTCAGGYARAARNGPPISASSQLVLHSPNLPWTIAIGPIGSLPSFFISKVVCT
ncbi:hypothetical protein H4582DRAFT_1533723 [Lactarius indigo]|nr:hypothetical protein H4582DRAFT_1533723 [Lactarius indigo]